jgi:hypothetical protein
MQTTACACSVLVSQLWLAMCLGYSCSLHPGLLIVTCCAHHYYFCSSMLQREPD